MARASIVPITTDDDCRGLVAQLLDLIDSFEPVVSPLSSQDRADRMLHEWWANRHLPPALRLSEIGGNL
jgi:hypothetical protein